jgi:hypothetical protein
MTITFLLPLLGKTHRNSYFCPQSGEEKRLFPLPIIVGENWVFNIDNPANPIKRKATGSDNSAFL